ncbi:MAG: hypothetical protein WCJ93_11710 [Methanomicrobiales archaeon]
MNSVKLIGCFAALIVLAAVIMPVSAYPYVGYSQVGSTYNGNQLSVSSALDSSMTGTNTPYMGYKFAVKGYGTKPALGDLTSYANYNSQTLGQKFSYSESSSVSGIIHQFSKTISITL